MGLVAASFYQSWSKIIYQAWEYCLTPGHGQHKKNNLYQNFFQKDMEHNIQ